MNAPGLYRWSVCWFFRPSVEIVLIDRLVFNAVFNSNSVILRRPDDGNLRPDDGHFDRIHSSLTAVPQFGDG